MDRGGGVELLSDRISRNADNRNVLLKELHEIWVCRLIFHIQAERGFILGRKVQIDHNAVYYVLRAELDWGFASEALVAFDVVDDREQQVIWYAHLGSFSHAASW